jgi:hypothetical protein
MIMMPNIANTVARDYRIRWRNTAILLYLKVHTVLEGNEKTNHREDTEEELRLQQHAYIPTVLLSVLYGLWWLSYYRISLPQ